MTPSFSFDGYTVRPLTEQDRPYLDLQIAADEYHRDRMTADFFLKLQPGEDAWALEDSQGMVVFYFKTETACRIHIQFMAGSDHAAKRKNAYALLGGLTWLEGILRSNRFRELLTDIDSPQLREFCQKHLGFQESPKLLSKPLSTQVRPKTQPRGVGTVPTSTIEVEATPEKQPEKVGRVS